MYLNLNNNCQFEGRLTKELEVSLVGPEGKKFTKVRGTLAVEKSGLTTAKKNEMKNRKEPTADFIPFECTGNRADFMKQFFHKGDAVKLLCCYRAFSYVKDGNTIYGHSFDVVDVTFTVGGLAANNQGGQNNNNQNNGQYNNQNNGQYNNNQNNQNNNSFDGIESFNDDVF